MIMSPAIFEAKWKQMRDQITGWWDKLSDNDVDTIAGRSDRLISLLQEKYGYTSLQAEAEIARRMESRAARAKEPIQ